MGQSSSSTLGTRGGRRRSLRDSIRSPKHKANNSTHTLSAACNFMDVNRKFELLNINTASEEELMTLPGITRVTAHTIVEYRQAIGRFKKVEDLALVSGIGADKLDLIRPEICVNRRRNVSCASSREPSTDNLLNTEPTRLSARNSPSRVVNINAASVFDLMAVQGFNQELAANVVHYRERRGPFRTVDELIKVKGINQWRLGALRSQVVAADSVSPVKVKASTLPVSRTDSLLSPLAVPLNNTNLLQVPNGRLPGHRKTMSVPIKYSPLTNGLLPNKDIFDLLSAYTQRPIVEEDFHNIRSGRPALRIASWNLTDFSADKADNPGVRETICRTILENSLSLIAVQEVCDTVALKKICDELNYPTLKRVVDWKGEEAGWEYSMPTVSSSTGLGLAFLYNANCHVEQKEMHCLTIEGCGSSTAVLAKFQLADVSVCLVNVSLYDEGGVCMQSVKKALEAHLLDRDLVVILGDMSGMNKSLEESTLQYKGMTAANSITNSCTPNGQDLRFYDNIYLDTEAVKHYTGVWGVVRQGLSHLAIPRGWMWGGPASEHCPVWCELYTGPQPALRANGTSHIVK